MTSRLGIIFLAFFLCFICLQESQGLPRGGRGGGGGGGRSSGGKGSGKQGLKYGGYLMGGGLVGYAAHRAKHSQGSGLSAWGIVAIIVGIALAIAILYHVLEYFCVNNEENTPPSSMNSSGNTLLIEDKEDLDKTKSSSRGHYQDNVKEMANGGLTLTRTDSFMKKGDTEVFL